MVSARGKSYDAERPSGLGLRLLQFVSAIVVVWLLAPMFIVIPMSLTNQRSYRFPPPGWSTEWYRAFFSDPAWYRSLMTSLEIAGISAAIATGLGTAAAFAVTRGRFRSGRVIANAFLLSPMIIPVVIMGIGVYVAFLRWHLIGSTMGFVGAHTSIAIPFVVVVVGANLRTFDRQLERAAASLGAGPLTTFFTVIFPLIRRAVLAAALFAFVTSFDEVVVATFLVSPTKRTLPVQMFTSVTQASDPTVAVASTVMISIISIALIFGLLLSGGRRDAS